ncbi:MAG TPA: iron ABC transporter permease [Anaerolineaceae bacterium]|nr:iron ABC transporter permease [Chloroflexota bacterium]HOA21514.1 iron ABC transporter permease [Anaerolineaceae bacterium]HOG77303.1 iron ABC transporter permease [Anaerolineaceae bacterium]
MKGMPGARWWKFLLWLLPAAFLLVFFYQPLAAILRLAFSMQAESGGQSFPLGLVADTFVFTFWQAALSTLLTLVVGLPAAYLFSHFEFTGRKFLRIIALLPFILPTVVVAVCFNSLLGPRGWLNVGLMALFHLSEPPIRLLNSLPAILLAHVFYNSSVIIRIVGGAWSRLDRKLTQAAQMLGANPWRVFWEVIFPLLLPAIAGASLLVFLFDFTSFGVVLMLGGPRFATLEVEIYTQALYLFNLPLAGMLSLVQLAFTLLIAWLHNRVSLPRYGKAALSAERANLRRPQTRNEKLFVLLTAVLLIALILLPLLSLVTRSVVSLEADRGARGEAQTGFTLRYYRELFRDTTGSIFYVPPALAVRNSVLYAGAAMLIANVLGLLASYALRYSGRVSRWLEPVLILPLGASAVTLGLGFVIVFRRAPWDALSFPLLIPFAHALVALPLVVRTLLPALRAIPDTLRQAAGTLGAGWMRVFREVDLPLLLRPLLVSMVFAFTISLGEFGASSFLSTGQNPTIPVAIYRYISQPGALNYGQALAMSTILLLVCAAGSLVIEKARLPGEELF